MELLNPKCNLLIDFFLNLLFVIKINILKIVNFSSNSSNYPRDNLLLIWSKLFWLFSQSLMKLIREILFRFILLNNLNLTGFIVVVLFLCVVDCILICWFVLFFVFFCLFISAFIFLFLIVMFFIVVWTYLTFSSGLTHFLCFIF